MKALISQINVTAFMHYSMSTPGIELYKFKYEENHCTDPQKRELRCVSISSVQSHLLLLVPAWGRSTSKDNYETS